MRRRSFLKGAVGSAVAGAIAPLVAKGGACASFNCDKKDVLDIWQSETDLVTPLDYKAYLSDGDTRGFKSLEKLEQAFEKVFKEATTLQVGDVPAVWSVYNLGYIVKTKEALFSIDLVHRRAAEFAPYLDFSLVSHNHRDHFHQELYAKMNSAHKLVISNFLDNYGACSSKERKVGGYVRGAKEFKIKDVTVRTSLVDHNSYLIDFTTAFEIRVGDWKLYHTGDCAVADKLYPTWGAPDLWLFFPMGALNVAQAAERVRAKRIVIGHIWELQHATGRLTTPMVRRAIKNAAPFCPDVTAGLWGDRLV